jgi:uncharacterized protein YggE
MRALMGVRAVVLASVLGLAAVLAAGCSSGGAEEAAAQTSQGGGQSGEDGVTVVGTGEVSGKPETLRARVGVEVTEPGVQAALDAANTAADKVLGALRDAGVADEDLQTAELSVRPQREPPREGEPPKVTGYVATNRVSVTITQIDQAGQILQAAAEAGGDAARIAHVRFALEDDTELLKQARQRAMQKAQAKASQYAELAEADLGEVISISEQVTGRPPVPQQFGGDAAALAQEGGAPPVEPGEQDVSVRVEVNWALQ